jgi:hypothetical protein
VGATLARGRVDLEAGEVAVEARLLDDRADAGQCRGASGGEVVAQHAHRAGGRLGEAEQEAAEGCLACAVGAEEAEGGAPRHLEVDAVESRPLAEALAEPAGLDGQGVGVHGTNLRAAWPPLFGRQDEPVPLPHPIG